MVFAGAALLGGVACSKITAEQRTWLSQGQQAYEAKEYSRSIDFMSRFLETELDAPETQRALYYKGLSEAYRGQRTSAVQDLMHSAEMAHDNAMTWRAYAAIGSIHFEDEKWDEAADAFYEASKRMPTLPPKDVVLYKLGMARERAGRWGDAATPYEQILAEFPDGEIARSARRRLNTRTDTFTVEVAEFAVPSNADYLAFELEQQGLRPTIRRERVGPKDVYVVTVGEYPTQSEAEEAAARVRERYPTAKVWP